MTRWIPAMLLLTACGARDELGLPGAGSSNGGVEVTAITLGYDHGCALLGDGTARCWGEGASGELGGAPTSAPQTTPVALVSPTAIAAMSAGYAHTCAVLHDGTLSCWGSDNLGNDGPAAPAAVASSVEVVSAAFDYDCAARDDGTVVCWGSGDHGQLGNGADASFHEPTPTPVQGVSGAVAVATGEYVTCALLQGGAVSCWGLGPLGDGATGDSSTPVAVKGLPSPAKQVVVGSMHACALLSDASVACWGYGGYGELGLGIDVGSATLPAVVSGLPPAVGVSACDLHTCALLADGTARCWGNDSAYTKGSYTPVAVPGLASARAIASGQSHDCALLESHRVVCWGDNSSGQLGDGTTTSRATPAEVVGLP